jgi:hypothetical protein
MLMGKQFELPQPLIGKRKRPASPTGKSLGARLDGGIMRVS